MWATFERAVKDLVSSRIDCGQRTFSIRDINEFLAPKSNGPFKSIREFGAHVAKYYRCSTSAEFQKATSHSFPVGKPFTIVYRAWAGRYRWHNEDGSHNAAVAQWYAHTHNEDFHFTADLYQEAINQSALDVLRKTTVRGFLMPMGGLLTEHHLRLHEFEVPFQTLTLEIQGKMREALFIYPGTEPGRIAADALLDKLKNPSVELTATLSSRVRSAPVYPGALRILLGRHCDSCALPFELFISGQHFCLHIVAAETC